jgi:hypothetical protein
MKKPPIKEASMDKPSEVKTNLNTMKKLSKPKETSFGDASS